IDGVLDRDLPSTPAGRCAERVDRTAACADQRGGDRPLLQEIDNAINGVAFADPAQIELDAWLVETDRPVARIEDDVPAADVPPGCAELAFNRQMAVALVEAPRFHQRTNSNVERPVRVTAG